MKNTGYILLTLLILAITASARDIETLKREIKLEKEEMVEVDMEMALVELKLSAGEPKYLMTADVTYDADKIRPIIEYSPGQVGFLRILSKKEDSQRNLKHVDNEWNLRFTDKIPLEFKIEIGLGECDFDLTDLKIADMDIEVGLAEMKINFKKPNPETFKRLRIESGLGEFVAEGLLNANCQNFNYSGGLGSSELYFTGKNRQPCEVEIEVGLGSVEIYIERGTPVKVYTEESFLSSVDIEGMKKIRNGVHISRDWDDEAQNRLILYLKVGLGTIKVQWY